MALEVLYYWGGDTEPALPSVIRAIDDPDRIVRSCAASVASQHVEKAGEAVPILMKWLDTDNHLSRLTAAALILRIDPSRHDEMVVVFRDGMGEQRLGDPLLDSLAGSVEPPFPTFAPMLWRQSMSSSEQPPNAPVAGMASLMCLAGRGAAVFQFGGDYLDVERSGAHRRIRLIQRVRLSKLHGQAAAGWLIPCVAPV